MTRPLFWRSVKPASRCVICDCAMPVGVTTKIPGRARRTKAVCSACILDLVGAVAGLEVG